MAVTSDMTLAELRIALRDGLSYRRTGSTDSANAVIEAAAALLLFPISVRRGDSQIDFSDRALEKLMSFAEAWLARNGRAGGAGGVKFLGMDTSFRR